MQPQNTTDTEKIRAHYDAVSPYYQELWGNHIHHGYYVSGKEPKEEATENLIKLLAGKAGIRKNSSVLDIGCGIGGTSIWLSKNYRCKVTGITISPVQAELAKKLAQSEALPLKPVFGVTDANSLKLHQKYDVLWAVEMISHLKNRKAFLTTCAQGLEDKGKLVIADWFKEQGIGREKYKRCIYPIEKGMMVSLSTSPEYIAILENSRLKLRYLEDISDNVKKTWDVCIGIIKSARFWNLATRQGKDFVQFLNAFHSMRRGFASGALRYEVMVFEK